MTPIKDQPVLTSIDPGEQVILDVGIKVPDQTGDYLLMVSFGSELLLPGINGSPVKLSVTTVPL